MTRKEYYLANKEKIKARNRAYYIAHREKIILYDKKQREIHRSKRAIRESFYQRKRKYGVNKEEFLSLINTQNGLCGICGKSFELTNPTLDHEHATEKIRGVLCRDCNIGLGMFYDNSDILRSAIIYLEKSKNQEDSND